MKRWSLILICLLALAVGSFAQFDDLDAILAGLGGDTPTEAPAAVAEEPAPVDDPFADLLADVPADVPEAVEAAAELEVDDPFADLFGDDWDDEAAVEPEPADVPEPVAEPALDDPFADLLGDDWDDLPEADAEPEIDDPFADLLGDEVQPAPAVEFDPFADFDEEDVELEDLGDAIDEDPLGDMFDDWEDATPPEAIPDFEIPEEDEFLGDFEDVPPADVDVSEEEDVVDEAEEAIDEVMEEADVVEEPAPRPRRTPAREKEPVLTPKVSDTPSDYNEPVFW